MNMFFDFSVLKIRVSATKKYCLFTFDDVFEKNFVGKAAVVGVIVQSCDSIFDHLLIVYLEPPLFAFLL